MSINEIVRKVWLLGIHSPASNHSRKKYCSVGVWSSSAILVGFVKQQVRQRRAPSLRNLILMQLVNLRISVHSWYSHSPLSACSLYVHSWLLSFVVNPRRAKCAWFCGHRFTVINLVIWTFVDLVLVIWTLVMLTPIIWTLVELTTNCWVDEVLLRVFFFLSV